MSADEPLSLARPSAWPPTPTRSCCGRPGRPTSRRRSAPSCGWTTAARPICWSPSRAASASAATRSWGSARGGCSQVRDGVARHPDPPARRRRLLAGPAGRPSARPPTRCRAAVVRAAPPGRCRPRACRASPAARSGPWPTTRSQLRADGAAARRGPGRRAAGGLHRDGPRARLRPPDPHPVGDRVAPHGGARPRGPLCDRRAGDLRGARADGPPERGRAGREPAGAGRSRPGAAAESAAAGAPARPPIGWRRPGCGRCHARRGASGRASAGTRTSDAVRVAKDAIAAGEAIQVVLARRQSIDLPPAPDGGCSTASSSIGRSAASTRARTSSSCGCPTSRSSARARSCCCRSRATP